MDFNVGIFFAQLINFAIIFFLFKKFVADKLIVLMHKRKKELQKAENAEFVFEETLAIAEQEKKNILTDAMHQKQYIIEEGTQLAEKKQAEILEHANKKANSLVLQAQEKIAHLEKDLQDGFLEGVKKTTTLVVKKMINDNVEIQQQYIAGLVDEMLVQKQA